MCKYVLVMLENLKASNLICSLSEHYWWDKSTYVTVNGETENKESLPFKEPFHWLVTHSVVIPSCYRTESESSNALSRVGSLMRAGMHVHEVMRYLQCFQVWLKYKEVENYYMAYHALTCSTVVLVTVISWGGCWLSLMGERVKGRCEQDYKIWWRSIPWFLQWKQTSGPRLHWKAIPRWLTVTAQMLCVAALRACSP